MSNLQRLCLDTNIYVLGVQQPDSEEYQILSAIGFYDHEKRQIEAEIILSAELIDQIRRVVKYLSNKDDAGSVLGRIWANLNIYYVTPNEKWRSLLEKVIAMKNIPTEDIEIFLTASLGNTDCFVSGNRELIRAIADFECLTPTQFIKKYL